MNHLKKDSQVKKNILLGVSILLLSIGLFFHFFIRVIPDYSIESGRRYVLINEYHKYKSGYCLKSGLVLNIEHKIKKGIIDYINKRNKADGIVRQDVCEEVGLKYCGYGEHDISIGTYASGAMSHNNWMTLVSNITPHEHEVDAYKVYFFNDLNSKSIAPENYLYVNLKNLQAGFNIPIIRYSGLLSYELFFNDSFKIIPNEMKLKINTITLSEHFKWINNSMPKYKANIKNKALNYKDKIKTNTGGVTYAIDECGNVNFNIKEYIQQKEDYILNK